MKLLIPTIVFLTIVISSIRLWPDFPAHGVSWEGSYEAFAHVIVGAMICGPIVFWMTDKRTESENADSAACISFWCGIGLTFGVEAICFYKQVM